MSKRPDPPFIRCASTFDGERCGLPAGHGEAHTKLIPSDAPWFDVEESFRRSWAQAKSGQTRPIEQLWGDFDGDGLGLCPKCHGAETRNGTLCLVCQNEARDDAG